MRFVRGNLTGVAGLVSSETFSLRARFFFGKGHRLDILMHRFSWIISLLATMRTSMEGHEKPTRIIQMRPPSYGLGPVPPADAIVDEKKQ